MAFVNPTNLRLLISVLTKKHLYAMQVCPCSFDHNRDAGILINLGCVANAIFLTGFAMHRSVGSPLNKGSQQDTFCPILVLCGYLQHIRIFRVPPGFDLGVNYGAGNQVCMLRVPAVMPMDSQIKNGAEMKQKMSAFLADLVPDAMRGKEMWRQKLAQGAFSLSTVEYEHVTIREANNGNQPFGPGKVISVKFKNPACQQAAVQ